MSFVIGDQIRINAINKATEKVTSAILSIIGPGKTSIELATKLGKFTVDTTELDEILKALRNEEDAISETEVVTNALVAYVSSRKELREILDVFNQAFMDAYNHLVAKQKNKVILYSTTPINDAGISFDFKDNLSQVVLAKMSTVFNVLYLKENMCPSSYTTAITIGYLFILLIVIIFLVIYGFRGAREWADQTVAKLAVSFKPFADGLDTDKLASMLHTATQDIGKQVGESIEKTGNKAITTFIS